MEQAAKRSTQQQGQQGGAGPQSRAPQGAAAAATATATALGKTSSAKVETSCKEPEEEARVEEKTKAEPGRRSMPVLVGCAALLVAGVGFIWWTRRRK